MYIYDNPVASLLLDCSVEDGCEIGLAVISGDSIGKMLHCINNENKQMNMKPEQDNSNIIQY